jgi:hypothetical protein
MDEDQKAIRRMMEQFPPGTPVPPHVIANGTCFHKGLIEHQQKHYLCMAAELSSAKDEIKANHIRIAEAEEYIKRIQNMHFFSRLWFLFTSSLPNTTLGR